MMSLVDGGAFSLAAGAAALAIAKKANPPCPSFSKGGNARACLGYSLKSDACTNADVSAKAGTCALEAFAAFAEFAAFATKPACLPPLQKGDRGGFAFALNHKYNALTESGSRYEARA
jgi:hypothetical protein